ncbi:MAG: Wzt carbohydrate-binding domain-containing protein, partial [Scytonema sp. PMC 1069.18]|nr:Wzt carbohydrate-binding domain-containing protein [Scytonema sp. PMC 1069.18]
IGDAIDAPVRSYSSGMAARLGFASAVHTAPDILLIDEVLAVGDVKFRLKCSRKLNELQQNGTSFILVSHNAYSILSLCNSAVYLLKGQLVMSGNTSSVMEKYEEDLFLDTQKTPGVLLIEEKTENESNGLDIIALFFRDSDGNTIESLVSGENTYLCIICKVRENVDNVSVRVAIRGLDEEGEPLIFLNSYDDAQYFHLSPGEHEIQVYMPYLGLGLGLYAMKVFIAQGNPPSYTLDRVDFFKFSVKKLQGQSNARFYQPRTWILLER